MGTVLEIVLYKPFTCLLRPSFVTSSSMEATRDVLDDPGGHCGDRLSQARHPLSKESSFLLEALRDM